MDVNDIIQVTAYCSSGNQLSMNVLHYVTETKVGTGATHLEVSARFDTLWNAAYIALLSSNARYRGIGTKKIVPFPATVEVFSGINADDGGVASDILPRQVCGVITKKTGLAGRAFRGRVYIPFAAEDDNQVSGIPEVPYTARLATLANLFEDTVVAGVGGNTNSFAPVLFHRDGATYTPITECVARSIWGTQRRRGDYGRTNVFPL